MREIEKDPFYRWWGVVFIIGVLLVIVLCSMCASANPGTGQPVLDSAEQLGELRSENAELTRRLDAESRIRNELGDAIRRAEANADGASGDLRKAIVLFTEYKRAVDNYFRAVADNQREATRSPLVGEAVDNNFGGLDRSKTD